MSQDTSEPKAKPARPLNRWGQGTLSILQIVFLAVALIALNYLAAHHFVRSDLSREAAYTLSPTTKLYLEKEISPRAKPMKWIMAYRRSAEFYERVRVLAEEYARLSDGKIELEIVDPLRSSDRTQELMATYGFPLTKDLIIIDARTDDSAVSTEEETETPALDANSTEKKTVRILNPHVKVVIAEDMTIYAKDNNGQRRSVGFQGEDVMTARLVESVEGRARKMYFVADKSRIEAEGEKSPLKFLQDLLQLQNVELRGLNIANVDEIPADAEGLALIAPKYDLTDKELAVLDKYWNRPRAAVLMLLKPGDTPPKLRTFLRGYGVTPRRDRVISMQDKSINSVARGVFTYGVDFTKDFALQGVIFEGATSSLEVREGADDLMNRQINPVGLIQATDGFWGETKFGEKNTTFDENEDTKASSMFYAASITRGAANNDKFAAETSRMIVVSNTDFLDPDRQHEENVDFLASSVNWLMDRQSLFGIGPRSLGTYKLPLLEAQVSFINRVNLFFLPALLAIIGAFVWSSRRA
ncbi:Gldg family protein [Luteolibacter yonseiensis]|uniref:Gldg family protein n=1 Tax=Luteolibacter yonseiensis TaxID=1144680 RepID=A0A934R7S2_9BACT|nr:Gldg family protein [Luteolibacter yonseiensis]MBK1816790.1 Gldg family protein [Luteolibacter yonseiensis]